MTARRCPLHAEPLRAGRRARVPATALAGRKHAFHAAERVAFPAAAAFLFCREGDLATDYCPACRAALRVWLDHPARRDLREALPAAFAGDAAPRG